MYSYLSNMLKTERITLVIATICVRNPSGFNVT